MADSSTLSFRLDGEIVDALDRAASENGISRSQLARECLLEGVRSLSGGEGAEEIEVPEWLGHEAEVREMIARNREERRRGKFRSEFSKQLRESFENNETPQEFRNSVAGYVEEADRLGELPEGVAEEIAANVDTFAGWVEHMLSYYEAAYRGQNWDHDPIDDPLGKHEGIENMREWMQRAESIAEAVEERDHDLATNLARHTLQDGLVPEHVEDRANEADNPARAVIGAAREIGQPQIEGEADG